MSVEAFVHKQLDLLSIEREAEIEETRILFESVSPKELQRRGVCLLRLRVGASSSGLYGRTVVRFEPFWPGKDLPAHLMSAGDLVGVACSGSTDTWEDVASGVVLGTAQAAVSVSFDEAVDELELLEDTQYNLRKLANDVTYRRLRSALESLHKFSNDAPSAHLIDVCFGNLGFSAPLPSLPPALVGDDGVLRYFNPTLDASQREAVRFALLQREVAIVHGPPGTGKTTTVVEIILQEVAQHHKVLVCAPSNVAVDNILERLAEASVNLVRLGHPARSLHKNQKHTLDARLLASDAGLLVEDVRNDINKTMVRLRKCKNKGEKQSLRGELRHFYKELKERQSRAMSSLLKEADVILATLTGSHENGPLKHLPEGHFDLLVIDECSQALEAACWIPLLQCSRCVLAGDHHQLPPTIVSLKAAEGGLELTLMERLLKEHGNHIMQMLTVQYRMHQLIMQWSSEQLYENKLIAHHSVATHLLKDLESVQDNEDTCIPLLLIDTTGCDMNELDVAEELSKGNEGEADIAATHVEKLIASGLSPADIAVITPYNLQVQLIRLRLSSKIPALEIKSVDGFQGREKEAVIISLVRSNSKREVGFLSESRRINVAITRARRHLCVICDATTVSSHDFLRRLTGYLESEGEVRSAHQYRDAIGTYNAPLPGGIMQKLTIKPSKEVRSPASHFMAVKKTKQKKSQDSLKVGDSRTLVEKPNCSEGSSLDKKAIEDESALRIEETMLRFVTSSDETMLTFPSTLSAFERWIVHEKAEKLGLHHSSQREGTDRHVIVWKESTHSTPLLGKNKESSERASDRKSDDSTIKTNRADARVATASEPGITDPTSTDVRIRPTHVVTTSCLRPKKPSGKRREGEASVCDAHKTQAKPKLPVQRMSKDDGRANETRDFDEVVDAFVKESRRCHQPKCKAGISILSQTCRFCNHVFCLGHHMPEVHGCADAVRAHARNEYRMHGVALLTGNKIYDSSKVDPVERARLGRKLEKKLDDFSGQRKRKQKPDKR